MKLTLICECTNTLSFTIGSNKNQDASKKRRFAGKEMQTWEQLMVLVIFSAQVLTGVHSLAVIYISSP